MNYKKLLTLSYQISDLILDILSNDLFSRHYNNYPFQNEIIALAQIKLSLDNKINKTSSESKKLIYFLNVMFNLNLEDIILIDYDDDYIQEKYLELKDFFSNIKKQEVSNNAINKQLLLIENSDALPDFTPLIYFQTKNKTTNDFYTISSKEINNKCIETIRYKFKKGTIDFYNKENKSNYNIYLTTLLFVFICSFIPMLFNLFFVFNISNENLLVLFILIPLIYQLYSFTVSVCYLIKLKNINYRRYTKFNFIHHPRDYRLGDYFFFLLSWNLTLNIGIVALIYKLNLIVNLTSVFIAILILLSIFFVLSIVCIILWKRRKEFKPELDFDLIIKLYNEYYSEYSSSY